MDLSFKSQFSTTFILSVILLLALIDDNIVQQTQRNL